MCHDTYIIFYLAAAAGCISRIALCLKTLRADPFYSCGGIQTLRTASREPILYQSDAKHPNQFAVYRTIFDNERAVPM